MVFDVRRFLIIFFSAGIASFVTLLVVQYLQGGIEDLTRVAMKACLVGFGIAIMFSLSKRRTDYPWM